MMTHDELIEFHKELCDNARELMVKKNHDYAGKSSHDVDNPNPFANFTRCESLGVCKTEQGFLVRMTDKFSRLSSFCEQGVMKVEDEKIIDTIQDIVNYAVLFVAYLHSESQRRDDLESKKHNVDSDSLFKNSPNTIPYKQSDRYFDNMPPIKDDDKVLTKHTVGGSMFVPIREGSKSSGGVCPRPSTQKPDITPPAQRKNLTMGDLTDIEFDQTANVMRQIYGKNIFKNLSYKKCCLMMKAYLTSPKRDVPLSDVLELNEDGSMFVPDDYNPYIKPPEMCGLSDGGKIKHDNWG